MAYNSWVPARFQAIHSNTNEDSSADFGYPVYRLIVSDVSENVTSSIRKYLSSAAHCTTRFTTYTRYMYRCHNTGTDRQNFKILVLNF